MLKGKGGISELVSNENCVNFGIKGLKARNDSLQQLKSARKRNKRVPVDTTPKP